MEKSWKDSINRQRAALAELLKEPLANLAERCVPAWGERQQIDEVLVDGFASVPYCTFLYVLDPEGIQISDNIGLGCILPEHFGRDRSQRPYMQEEVPPWGYLLSDAYISLRAKRPSLTALQVIRNKHKILGYLGADFDLRDLPMTAELYEESNTWRQIKGDPAIRSGVFQQTRVNSLLDQSIEQSMAILEELFTQRGLFQTVIHFSSSRATIWLMSDPYRYRILDHEALNDPDICLAYPHSPYPKDALIPANRIAEVLGGMRELRLADETIYLRSASINIFNGLISLTFSCDGSHYMSYKEFLDKNMSFWLGGAS
ncbi:MAG: PDC sensor domain-containing protein [Gammaproteobacteria bacterium]|nr:PDC sensor domain-containing protein [Gammaproteobacteria bacterium]